MIRAISSLLIIAGLTSVTSIVATADARNAAAAAAPNARSAVSMAAMHARLTRAEPAPDDTVRTAPTAIRLWFSEAIEVALTSVTVTGPSGAVAVGQPAQGSASNAPVVFDAGRPLSSGSYTVMWRTVGKDGHPTHGTYRFIVAPTQPAASTHR